MKELKKGSRKEHAESNERTAADRLQYCVICDFAVGLKEMKEA
jgi:hypothetical protein